MFKFTDPWKTILRVVDVLSEVERRVSHHRVRFNWDRILLLVLPRTTTQLTKSLSINEFSAAISTPRCCAPSLSLFPWRLETFHPKITTTTDRYLVLEPPPDNFAAADIESLGMKLDSRTLLNSVDPETK